MLPNPVLSCRRSKRPSARTSPNPVSPVSSPLNPGKADAAEPGVHAGCGLQVFSADVAEAGVQTELRVRRDFEFDVDFGRVPVEKAAAVIFGRFDAKLDLVALLRAGDLDFGRLDAPVISGDCGVDGICGTLNHVNVAEVGSDAHFRAGARDGPGFGPSTIGGEGLGGADEDEAER
jgi:hypothetical protein